ncbi:MAG: hypothetical protein ABJM29_18235 [Rhizobiaceae bacterium]
MTNQIKYKAHNDGSIDYAHYMRHGRTVRSQAAHGLAKSIWSWVTTQFRAAPAAKQVSQPVLIASNKTIAKSEFKTAA